MSLARRIQRQERPKQPVHTSLYPSPAAARDALKRHVDRAAGGGIKPRALVAVVNVSDPACVRVTLGLRGYWRWVASQCEDQSSFRWLLDECPADCRVIIINGRKESKMLLEEFMRAQIGQ
jgi:hypothetical protein